MSRWIPILAGAMALAWAVPAPAASSPCKPRGAKVVGESTRVLVVRLRNRITQVCDRRTGRTRRLDDTETSSAALLGVAGRYVAYELYVTGRDGVAVTVRLLDRVRSVRTYQSATGSALEHQGTDRGVLDFELEPDGDMAWISEPWSAPGLFEVWSAPRGERATLVGEGRDIVPDSLARGGSWLYWSTNAGPRSARVG
jgi:hypothetical protein